ncbi:TRAP-type mannitol/chloroaromatic compound transport system, small permease component [Burkholderiales bacterium]|nr:TRAP-type mannitol/chloroaromatic compound transport system, small permease component [Burkholderiales bacterium]
MKPLLAFCRVVDWVNEKLAWLAAFAVLAACLISAGNALIRYAWDISSNAWLEIQWYLFATTVMLGAAYVLRLNEHVRVDIFYTRLRGKGPVLLDLFGLVCFLLPVMLVLLALSWPIFLRTLLSGEVSSNAGGLVRWPAVLLLPLGFAMVFLQAVAEIIKRIAYLRGEYAMDAHYAKPVQ